MTDRKKKPSLLDPEAAGGDIAEGGFRFQDHLILARIPMWLACDGFSEMIREALGDTEARFFVPDRGMAQEFVEYKSHQMAPSEFWSEIDRFCAMDAAHPGSYWRFELVCTGVSDVLRPMLNGLRRVRDAFPFYSNSMTIQDASYEAFSETVRRLGKDKILARFIFDKVVVDTDPAKSLEQGFEMFRGSLERHFPVFQEMGAKPARKAWESLAAIVSTRKAKPICRSELEAAIWSGVADGLPVPSPIRFFTASELLAGRWETPPDLRFDWSMLSGGTNRGYPPAKDWNDKVVDQLTAARDWIVATKRSRRVFLSGQRRLSASVALGAILNAVHGFSVDMQHRDAIWSTDDHATPDTPQYAWRVDPPTIDKAPELAVSIGIGRDPAPEVLTYLSENRPDLPLLVLAGTEPLVSAQHVNAAVRGAKAVMLDALAKSGAAIVHLFLATPAHFALFLGHRLNTTGVIQCYERVRPNVYQATCRLSQS